MKRKTLVPSVLAVAAALAAGACSGDEPEPVPYNDTHSVGLIALYDKGGKVVTKGKTTDKPFIAKAVSQAKAPAPYDKDGRKATLLAFLPRKDIDPTQWNGKFLTGASAYDDAGHPTVVSPAEAGSLADFLATYPTQWNGLVQLRIYLGVPGESTLTTSYATADIKVTGDTWTVVRGAAAGALGVPHRMVVQPAGLRDTGVPISVQVGDGTNPSNSPSPTGGGGGPLPRTGSDVVTLAGIGVLFVAAGTVAVVLGRRRSRGRKVAS